MKIAITERETPEGIYAIATLPTGQTVEEFVPFAELAGYELGYDELGRRRRRKFGSRLKNAVKKVAKSKLVSKLKKFGPVIKKAISYIPVYGQIVNAGIDGAKAVAKLAKKAKAGNAKAKQAIAGIKAAKTLVKPKAKALPKPKPKRRRKPKARPKAKLQMLAKAAKSGNVKAKAIVAAAVTDRDAKRDPTPAKKARAVRAKTLARKLTAAQQAARVIKRSGGATLVELPSGLRVTVRAS